MNKQERLNQLCKDHEKTKDMLIEWKARNVKQSHIDEHGVYTLDAESMKMVIQLDLEYNYLTSVIVDMWGGSNE